MDSEMTPINIGPHRLLCGDLTAGAVDALMGEERADVVYCDPPWGPGLLQMFATMNESGSSPRLSWSGFLAAFSETIVRFSRPEAPIFVEMGLRWVDELDETMAKVGRPPLRRWDVSYGPTKAPRPNSLTLYGLHDVPVELPDPPHGEAVTRAALAAVVREGSLVLDPCTGLGMTARFTHAFGGAFRGVELNPARLDRTAAWLRARTRAKGTLA